MNQLKYSQAANTWTEALPLGNGRIGAMHFGGIEIDQFQLNEDTLWSGPPEPVVKKDNQPVLERIRALIDAKEYETANEETKKLFGPYTESYLPLGNLYIQSLHGDIAEGYKRILDIERALSLVEYQIGAVTYKREAFISHPHQVMVVHLTSSAAKLLNIGVTLDSTLMADSLYADESLVLRGICPESCDPVYVHESSTPIRYGEPRQSKAIHFEGRLGIATDDGHISATGGKVWIREATSITLYFAVATSFNGFDRMPGRDYQPITQKNQETLTKAMALSYEDLKQIHEADHQQLFNRVALDLGGLEDAADDTDLRVLEKGAADLSLVELLFQYGRYLLIASSREGSQPANLQGIWNPLTRAPWSSNYTLNINTPMNYWPAEVTNLSECHKPLLKMLQEMAVTGEKMVTDWYGIRGWTAHHNTDLWRHTYPVGGEGHGDATWAYWPMSGPWLCRHLWEHYLYSQDEDYLRTEAFPILKGSAFFCLDWLIEDDSGYLITSPSTSPENQFLYEGQVGAVTKGTTMDLEIISELFTTVLEAATVLGLDDEDWLHDVQQAKARLHPLQVGKRGQLQEWLGDFDDSEPQHRHVSHLYAVYPGQEITPGNPLVAAVENTLNERGDVGTGWSLGWKICLWARLNNGERILSLFDQLFNLVAVSTESMSGGGLYPNLLGAHPPFQIDGNFSFTAGVSEMLLQSHQGYLDLLPALPDAWANGAVSGLLAQGGFEVSLQWEEGTITQVEVTSLCGLPLVMRTEEPLYFNGDAELQPQEGFITLPTTKNQKISLKKTSQLV